MKSDDTPLMDRTKDRRKYEWVKNHINERMSRGNGQGPFAAVEALVKEGVIGFPDNRRFGKLARGDKNITPQGEDFYDGLIMPGYSSQVLNGPNRPIDVPVAPNSIRLVDMEQALERLNSGTVNKIKMNANYGAGGRDYERLQLKPEFSRRPENGIEDAVKGNPLLQQLLDVKTMKKLIV